MIWERNWVDTERFNKMNKLKSYTAEGKKLLNILNREQKIYGIFILILSLGGALLETLGVSIVLPLVNAMLEPEKLMKYSLVRELMHFFRIEEASNLILLIGILTILIYVIKNIYFIVLAWVRTKYACKIQGELSVYIMESYMNQGYSFFLSRSIGDLQRSIAADVNGVYNVLLSCIKIFVEVVTIIAICIFILLTDPIMAGAVLVLALVCLLLISNCFRVTMKKAGDMQRHYFSISYQASLQAFQGIKEILVSNREKFFVNLYKQSYMMKQKAGIRQSMGAESPSYIIEAICVSGLIGMICIRLAAGNNDAQSMIPTLSAFAIGAFRILPSLGKVSSNINVITFNLPSLDSVYDNMQMCEELNRKQQEHEVGYVEKKRFEKELKICDVSFEYEGKPEKVLDGVNLSILKGESIAFVGQSGAGKTTLADIILGLLVPQRGSVQVDGGDIFSLGGTWNQMIGYVPQNIYLTDDTVRNNIAFGIDRKFIDENKVWNALEQAQLKEFIEKLPQGLDTTVGERGVRFSGGQRQRIAIARALYSNPDILVMDEATAALDNETETAVMESIEALKGKKTIIIIAHRLTTVENCNKIYEIVGGKAMERKYEELV